MSYPRRHIGRRRGPADRVRLLEALQADPTKSLHSFDIRQQLHIGNPSERVRDLKKAGWRIEAKRETRNGRTGTRYTLIGRHSAHLAATSVRGPGSPGGRAAAERVQTEAVWDYTDPTHPTATTRPLKAVS